MPVIHFANGYFYGIFLPVDSHYGVARDSGNDHALCNAFHFLSLLYCGNDCDDARAYVEFLVNFHGRLYLGLTGRLLTLNRIIIDPFGGKCQEDYVTSRMIAT